MRNSAKLERVKTGRHLPDDDLQEGDQALLPRGGGRCQLHPGLPQDGQGRRRLQPKVSPNSQEEDHPAVRRLQVSSSRHLSFGPLLRCQPICQQYQSNSIYI